MVRITLDKPYIPIPVPVTAVKYGLLYNWYAATDARNITSSNDWIVPTSTNWNTLITYLGGSGVAGGKLKETGLTHWVTPNTGATNEVNYNGRGAGVRSYLGAFSEIGLYLWLTNYNFQLLTAFPVVLRNNNDDFNNGINDNENKKRNGVSIRIFRTATTEEQALADGTACTPYTGNDGKNYRTVKIGTQVWIADNLCETKFRNGDWIPGFDGGVYTPFSNAAWAALTTGALCAYNNDWSNVLI